MSGITVVSQSAVVVVSQSAQKSCVAGGGPWMAGKLLVANTTSHDPEPLSMRTHKIPRRNQQTQNLQT